MALAKCRLVTHALVFLAVIAQCACGPPPEADKPRLKLDPVIDLDRDTVVDVEESCADVANGPGCVQDTDEDGVLDDVDQCVRRKGRAPSGCPQQAKAPVSKAPALGALIDTIYFQADSANFERNPSAELNALAELSKAESSALVVIGFAHEAEIDAGALALRRAERVRSYLVKRSSSTVVIKVRSQVMTSEDEIKVERSRRVDLAFEAPSFIEPKLSHSQSAVWSASR